MKYVVPVNAAEEVRPLSEAGAAELYCGYQDAWWIERYGDHDSASRRQGAANLRSKEELASVAEAARECGVPLRLALNARYTEAQLDYLLALCDEFERMGGAGVIVSDLGLLWRLKERTGLERCLSLLAVAQNAPTLEAFHELGVTRAVLPRFVGPEEAGALLSAVPGIQGEVMAFFDKCPLVDGYCRHRHGVTYADRQLGVGVGAGGANAAGSVAGKLRGGLAWSDDGAEALYTFDTTYRAHACLGSACTYLDPYPCGACHLPQYRDAGVGFAKIGGRGRPLEERLRALRFLKRAEQLDVEGRRALYRSTFDEECSCYYGERIQNRRAIESLPLPADVPRQVCVGSQTDPETFEAALADLVRGRVQTEAGQIVVLVPPLSDAALTAFLASLPNLAAHCPTGTQLCVNDLGTFVAVSREIAGKELSFDMAIGALLARTDDPDEVAHFLSPDDNPPRPVWDLDGNPRMLKYRHPPAALVEHWKRPSMAEPSAQAALRSLAMMR